MPKDVRVIALAAGDDQDQALRQVLALYRRPWPLLVGRDVAGQLALPPRSVLLVARGGFTVAVLKAPFGAELGAALAALQRNDVPETVPRPSWNRRPVDRSPLPPPPGLLPEGFAPGEDEPLPPEFAAAVEAYRAGRPQEALAGDRRARGEGRRLAAPARGAARPRALPRRPRPARRGAADPAAHGRQPVRGRDRQAARGGGGEAVARIDSKVPGVHSEVVMADKARAVIETKFGEIEIEFLADKAPGHVKNFLDLAKKGFYDGTTFHRVIPGFMIQGGDPNTKDASTPRGSTAPAARATRSRPSSTTRRTSAASSRWRARTTPNSAGSQFFICVADSTFLDRQYSAFGRVVRGMEVADKIVNAPRDGRDNPNDRIDMKVRVVEPAA